MLTLQDSFCFIVLVLILTTLSVLFGRILFWIDKQRWVTSFTRKLMSRLDWNYEEIRASIVGCFYYLAPLIAIIILCIIFRFPLYRYMSIDMSYIAYIPITICGELSVVTMMSGCLTLISDRINWTKEIGNISWISSIQKRNPKVAVIAPMLGALVEELFFRGICFLMIYSLFTEIGYIWPMIISTILFTLEQVLFTNNRKQGLSMVLGSIAIGIVGSISVIYTKSLLPSLLAHESFLIFYFGRFKYY